MLSHLPCSIAMHQRVVFPSCVGARVPAHEKHIHRVVLWAYQHSFGRPPQIENLLGCATSCSVRRHGSQARSRRLRTIPQPPGHMENDERCASRPRPAERYLVVHLMGAERNRRYACPSDNSACRCVMRRSVAVQALFAHRKLQGVSVDRE